jgi:hypothetical protein
MEALPEGRPPGARLRVALLVGLLGSTVSAQPTTFRSVFADGP